MRDLGWRGWEGKCSTPAIQKARWGVLPPVMLPSASGHTMRLVALDWVNFLLADVRGGLGAYVIVYLVTRAHWSQATVGAVLTVSGLTGIMLHPSVGALIDNIPAKRAPPIAAT